MAKAKTGRAFPPQDYSALITPDQARRLKARRRAVGTSAPERFGQLPPEWKNPPRWVVRNPDALRRWEQERAAALEKWNRGGATSRAQQEQAITEFIERWKQSTPAQWK